MKVDFEKKWKAERERKSFLALEDGTIFYGTTFGAPVSRCGEVVFNTGMCGYQEILTDPSYAGQFVTLTAAEVGNYGINSADCESRGLFLSGLVIGDLTEPSNFRSEVSLGDYLKANGIPGIYGIDTRALTIHLREHGNQKAYLHLCAPDGGEQFKAGKTAEEAAVEAAQNWEGLDGQDYASKVSCRESYIFRPDEIENECGAAGLKRITAYDFGIKTNILRSIARWAEVTVVPATTPAAEVLATNPDGIFLSNGPADPAALPYAAANIREFLRYDAEAIASGRRPIPLMGICLGHQLLSIACGARTGRLKFGHHGCNHPVRNLATGKVEITSQNHNFAVIPDSVPECLEVTHINLNDGSIEGIRHKSLPAFSVQYHPESCPGPHDSSYLFGQFKDMVLK